MSTAILERVGPVRVSAVIGDDGQLPLLDAYGAPWREKLPHATFKTLPGCGHVPMYDDLAHVVSTILALTEAPSTTG